VKTCPQCKQRFPDDVSFCYADGFTLEPFSERRLGTIVAHRYLLDEVLGKGRLATVYRGMDFLSGRAVAVKVFADGTGNVAALGDAGVKAELVRGATALERVVHPSVAAVHAAGQNEDGEVFVVTERAPGQSLALAMRRGTLGIARVLDVALQIATALTRAHDFALVHGDLRAENVFVGPGDRVELTDFGFARAHAALRSPVVAAPEPMLGPFADLYGFGVLLFQMLTGALPFEAPDREALVAKHESEPAPRASERAKDVPPPLDELVASLLAKTPMGRPVDAHAVVARLLEIAASLSLALPDRSVPAAKPTPTQAELTRAESRWRERLAIFTEMMKRAFPAGNAGHAGKQFDELRARIGELGDIRGEVAVALERESIVADESKESLARIGDALGAVMVDASRLRQEVRARGGALDPDLTAQLSDVDYQVKDLRGSMEALLADLAERRSPLRTELEGLAKRWTDCELELLTIAARLCAPLRARPELVNYFNKLA
jgi:hypothetical protein